MFASQKLRASFKMLSITTNIYFMMKVVQRGFQSLTRIETWIYGNTWINLGLSGMCEKCKIFLNEFCTKFIWSNKDN